LLLLLLLAHRGFAHDLPTPNPAPVRVKDQDVHRPTALPDRIVLTWSDHPTTTQAINWRTSTNVHRAIAQIAIATDRPQSATNEFIATTQTLESDLGPAHYHSVEFRGLQPGSLYAYRVGDSTNWSEWLQFRTAKTGEAPFTFLYFGDAQNDIRTHWSRVVREAFREAPRAAFTLHAGDLVNSANRDAEWGEWLGAPGWVNAVIPVLPTPGNHEYFGRRNSSPNLRLWDVSGLSTLAVTVVRTNQTNASGSIIATHLRVTDLEGRTGFAELDGQDRFVAVDGGITNVTGYTMERLIGSKPSGLPLNDRPGIPVRRFLTPHWRTQFTLPLNGPEGLEETVYHLDYQGVRFISLNSNEQPELQAAWLRDVLARNPHRWTIVTFHHPIFSPAKNRDNPNLRALWKPLFDEFRVDLVLTGHDHTYARTGDVTQHGSAGSTNFPSGYQQAYDPSIGTVYVVSVSGPKMYAQEPSSWAVRRAEDTQLFQVISIDGDELRFEARTATGLLYDVFRLLKRAGQANQLIEALPPENRRAAKPPLAPTNSPGK
jgi:3',5'-cyclic AMP phosphodiesterase CpdA